MMQNVFCIAINPCGTAFKQQKGDACLKGQAQKTMQKYTKAESIRIMAENKTQKAINTIEAIGVAVHVKTAPFESTWATEICNALRKSVDELENTLLEECKRKQPFRLSNSSGEEED